MASNASAPRGAHTPTPWFAVNVGTKGEPMWTVKAARIAGQPPRHEVAICATGDSPQDMETANAAFIVLACNSFDELVAALEFYANKQVYEPDAFGRVGDLTFVARNALAKARGETR